MEKLYLGVDRQVITPKVGGTLYGYFQEFYSDSVADDLTATVFYFQQGDTKALMVSLTICSIQTRLSNEIRKTISDRFGIPAENTMLCCTHTHSGPNTTGGEGWGEIDREYCDSIFIPQILKAAESAVKNTQIVKLGVGQGNSQIGVNRRELTRDNAMELGQNPWGSYNPQMTVLAFTDEDGNPVANMIHYGLHGTAAGANHSISRDWSGVMTDRLEKQTGAITAFFNGPEGDVGPRLSNGRTTGGGDFSYVNELGWQAARDAVSVYNSIYSYDTVKLLSSGKELQLPLQKRMRREDALAMQEEYKNTWDGNVWGMIKSHLKDVLASYEDGTTDAEFGGVDQTVIALGDVVFASFPYELFSAIGMRIDKAFKTKSVLSLSNTNGSEGYFVTEDAICRGGYEVKMFLYGHLQPFYNNGDFHLMDATIKHIESLFEE